MSFFNVSYGHIFSNTTQAVIITDTTPVKVTDGFTTGAVRGITYGANHFLRIIKAGTYKIDWSMSAAQNSPGAAIELEGGIMIDGVAQIKGASHRYLANGTDIGAFGGTAIIFIVANAPVSLYVKNETNATNIDVEHANLSIVGVNRWN